MIREKKYLLNIVALPLFIFVLLFFACSENSVESDPINLPDSTDSGLKVLFIGNSYTYYYNMPQIFDTISTRSGREVYVGQSVAGGKHVPYFVKDSTTHAMLQAEEWDYVVFQLFQLIVESEDRLWQHLPNAIAMDSIIHHYQPQAKTVLFMEQAYNGGDFTYDPQDTFLAMTERIKRGSVSFAQQMGTNPIIAPVAVTWGEVSKSQIEYDLFEPNDGGHPNLHGAYTTACVFYSTIFKEVLDVDYYSGLDPTYARLAQQTASSTVLDSLALWNNQ